MMIGPSNPEKLATLGKRQRTKTNQKKKQKNKNKTQHNTQNTQKMSYTDTTTKFLLCDLRIIFLDLIVVK
jgi:hypothetical protein